MLLRFRQVSLNIENLFFTCVANQCAKEVMIKFAACKISFENFKFGGDGFEIWWDRLGHNEQHFLIMPFWTRYASECLSVERLCQMLTEGNIFVPDWHWRQTYPVGDKNKVILNNLKIKYSLVKGCSKNYKVFFVGAFSENWPDDLSPVFTLVR